MFGRFLCWLGKHQWSSLETDLSVRPITLWCDRCGKTETFTSVEW